ncbi:hypothetical protein LVY75_34560 (plasmid) [Sinorhizobium sp. B11]
MNRHRAFTFDGCSAAKIGRVSTALNEVWAWACRQATNQAPHGIPYVRIINSIEFRNLTDMTVGLHAFTVAEGNVDAHEEIFDSNVEHLCEPVECTRAYAIDTCLVFLNLRKTNANGCAQNGLTETFGFADPQEVLTDKCID